MEVAGQVPHVRTFARFGEELVALLRDLQAFLVGQVRTKIVSLLAAHFADVLPEREPPPVTLGHGGHVLDHLGFAGPAAVARRRLPASDDAAQARVVEVSQILDQWHRPIHHVCPPDGGLLVSVPGVQGPVERVPDQGVGEVRVGSPGGYVVS